MISINFTKNRLFTWSLQQLDKEIYQKILICSMKNYLNKIFPLIIFPMSNLLPLVLEIHLMSSLTKLPSFLMTDLLSSVPLVWLKEGLEMINMMKNMKLFGKIGHHQLMMKLVFHPHLMCYFHQIINSVLFLTKYKDQHLNPKITSF